MSHKSELIRQAPRPDDDDSLFLVYASAQTQDWLHSIMQWEKTNPIDVSSMEPHDTIASWTAKKKPDAIIYCCKIWSETEKKIISKLRSTFPSMPIIVLIEKSYFERAAARSLTPLQCTVVFKDSILNKSGIISALQQAQSIVSP